MDPVTILKIAGTAATTAKAAWNVGESLYTFCSDVKIIDQTVSNLITEVRALSSACTLFDERLRDIVNDFEAEVKDRQPIGASYGAASRPKCSIPS